MKTKVLIMNAIEFEKVTDNDSFEYNDDTVLIVIDKKTGKISVDMQTECVKSSTCINRVIKAIEQNTELENTIKSNILEWLNAIVDSMNEGVFSDYENINGEYVQHGYSYGIEFVGDGLNYNVWYMYLNFYIDEIVETETETKTGIKTNQTAHNNVINQDVNNCVVPIMQTIFDTS